MDDKKTYTARGMIRKLIRPLLIVFGFFFVLFAANLKSSKIGTHDIIDSGVAHADAPAPSCADSASCAASSDSSGDSGAGG